MIQNPVSESRRAFFSRLGVAGAILGAPTVLAACGGGSPSVASACAGYSGLTPQDIQVRETFQYVDKTRTAAQMCSNCLQYTEPGSSGACGGCKLFAGPVLAGGRCTGWVARPA